MSWRSGVIYLLHLLMFKLKIIVVITMIFLHKTNMMNSITGRSLWYELEV